MCEYLSTSLHPPELPVPGVELTVSSETGSEEESCLNVEFSDESNSLTCVADVVSNLVNPPRINITRDGSVVDSVSDYTLTYSLDDVNTGEYKCIVCIDVEEAEIIGHCNETALTLRPTGEYTCTYICTIFASRSLSTVPGLITPIHVVDSVSEVTIDWSSSHSADVVRYIVDVRRYSSAGPGQVRNTSITGYPLEIPGTTLQHTVKSLGNVATWEYPITGNVIYMHTVLHRS